MVKQAYEKLKSDLRGALLENRADKLRLLLDEMLLFVKQTHNARRTSSSSDLVFLRLTVDELLDLLSAQKAPQEQLSEKINALLTQIEDQVSGMLGLSIIGQGWFIDKMKALNYKITGAGECFGMSNMAIQAFFADDMNTFYKRLRTILDIPIEDFDSDFKNLRKKQKQFIAKGQQDKADELNQTIVDIYAFFDGIALTQKPNRYFLGKDYQPLSQSQDLRKTRPITMPVKLEAKDEKGEYPNIPEILAPFASAYSKEGLIEYLDLLKDALGQKSFALNLIGNKHAIALVYDSKTKRWLLINPSRLSDEEYTHSNILADALWTDLLNYSRDVLVMGSQINVRAQDEQYVQQKFDLLQQSKTWSSLHDASKMNKTYYFLNYDIYTSAYQGDLSVYGNPSRLLASFSRTKDYEPIKDEKLLEMLVKHEQYDIAAQFMIAKGITGSSALFDKVFSSIVMSQQNNLLEAFSIEQKVSLILAQRFNLMVKKKSTLFFGNDTIDTIWCRLPDSDLIPVFLRLGPSAQAECLIELPQDHFLYNRLSSLATFEQKNTTRSLVVDEPQKKLFHQLGIDDKQALIDASTFDPKGQMTFFLLLSDLERLTVFAQIGYLAQSKLLVSLTNEQVGLRHLLDNSLSIDQKTHIINAADNNDKYPIFSMFTEQDQLAMFDKLSGRIQMDFLGYITPPAELERFIATLSIDQRITIINTLSTYRDSQLIIQVFESLTEQEQVYTFAELSKIVQHFFFKEMTDNLQTTQLEKFIAVLLFDQKISLIQNLRQYNKDAYFQLISKIFKSIPTTIRIDAYKTIKYDLYGTLPESLFNIFMSLFTEEDQFDLISSLGSEYDRLPLSQVKNIILDKLKRLTQGEPANIDSFFDKMKVKIMDAETKDEITEAFCDLLDFLKHPVKQTDLVCATTQLTTDGDTEKALDLTLTEMLQPLGLTKETLTSSSLKLVYRRIHPDKTKQTYQNMHQIFDDIKVLQTFMSTNGLVRYQEDKTFRAHVKLRLSGITLDDQSCLIQKSIVSIQKESRNMNLSNEWVDMVHQLMILTLQAYKMGDLTYNNTLDILSSTAQAMTYPERSQDVSQQIEKYKDHMSEPLLQAADRFIKQVTTHAFGKQSKQEHGESDIEPSPQQKHKRILDLNSNDETDEIPSGNKPSC